jgi:hypothetical protein
LPAPKLTRRRSSINPSDPVATSGLKSDGVRHSRGCDDIIDFGQENAGGGNWERAVSQFEKTREEVCGTGAQISPAPERALAVEIDVPAEIRRAIEKHRSDLTELMKKHEYRWAAYRGDERLEIGDSKRSLYRKYLDRGMSLDELVVLGIGPQIPDEIDGDDGGDV